jgi:hypothetical protein
MAWEKTKEYVLSHLGYPTIAVEITDKQLEICIREACDRWFEYRTPVVKYHYFQLMPNKDIYDLPSEMLKLTPQGFKIINVLFRPSNFEQFQYFFQYTLYNYQPLRISYIYMLFMNLETFQNVTGQFCTWEIVEGTKIRISPIPKEQTDAAIIYCLNHPDSYLDENLWIQKFALAKAKQIVGTVRSKFSIPTPTGGSVNLEGGTLIEQGRTEEEKLMDELINKAGAMPIMVG